MLLLDNPTLVPYLNPWSTMSWVIEMTDIDGPHSHTDDGNNLEKKEIQLKYNFVLSQKAIHHCT